MGIPADREYKDNNTTKEGPARMDTPFIGWMLAELKKQSGGVDPMSPEFIFDRKYARLRNSGRLFGGTNGSRSVLSFVLRDAMTQDRREKLFPGDFDLGNQRQGVSGFLCARRWNVS